MSGTAAAVAVGRKVPPFGLPATGGADWSLAAAAGSVVVLYFYPKDMTTGCTLESQRFRDLQPAFRRAGAQIVGVSRDSVRSHERFREKERLPFVLLADEEEKLCRLFGVLKEKTLYGRKHIGIERSTFLIDGQGVLRREWRKVKVDGHAEEVLEAAKSL